MSLAARAMPSSLPSAPRGGWRLGGAPPPSWGGAVRTAVGEALPVTPARQLGPPPPRDQVLCAVRLAVRDVLEQTPAYERADPHQRRALANKMVAVSMAAANLMADDAHLTATIRGRSADLEGAAQPNRPAVAPVVATAQAAGDQFSGVAAQKGAEQLRALREAIDFPTYVQSLITGVFQAITKSSIAQLDALGDLLENVAASQSSFGMRNISDGTAARWLVGRFPYFEMKGADGKPQLTLRDGVDLAEKAEELKEGLEATTEEVSQIDDSELLETLIPLVRRKMGRDKQAMMATMVMLGLQRIVVDQGRLHASMDMRVDTRSIAEQQQQDRLDTRVSTAASGSFGYGPWAASASVSATVGYVKSDEKYSKEELASQAALRSSVDLVFRTEQIPLDRVATGKQQKTIAATTPIPATQWTSGSLLEQQGHTKHQDFGALPGAPAAPSLDSAVKLAQSNPAKDKTKDKDKK